MTGDNGLIKMAELIAATGVSKQTIHFYLREGLLSPPVQTGRNMAYYDDRHIKEIRMIKDLQEKRYYPLSLIKMIMEGRRQGKDISAVDHLETFDDMFSQSPEYSETSFSHREFAETSGLNTEVLDRLAEAGLVGTAAGDQPFSSYDLDLARAIEKIIDLGFTGDDLHIYRDYLDLMRREVLLAHDRIITNPLQQPHPPLAVIGQAMNQVKTLLTKQAFREMIMEHKDNNEREERGVGDA